MGTQDDLDFARGFVADTGVTFPMTWDESGAAWVDFDIPAQPAVILYDASGRELGRWNGVFRRADVEAALG